MRSDRQRIAKRLVDCSGGKGQRKQGSRRKECLTSIGVAPPDPNARCEQEEKRGQVHCPAPQDLLERIGFEVKSGRKEYKSRQDLKPDGPSKKDGQDEPAIEDHENEDWNYVGPLRPARRDGVECCAADADHRDDDAEGPDRTMQLGVGMALLQPPCYPSADQKSDIRNGVERLRAQSGRCPFAINIDRAIKVAEPRG